MNDNAILITKKSKKLRGEDESQVVSIRMKKTTIQRMEDIAAKTNRTRNEVINIILDNAKITVE